MKLAAIFLLALSLSAQPALVGSTKVTTAGTTRDMMPHSQVDVIYTATSGNMLCVFMSVNNTQIADFRITDSAANLYFASPHIQTQFISDTNNGPSWQMSCAVNITGGALTITSLSIGPGGGLLDVTSGYTAIVMEFSGFGINFAGDGSPAFTTFGNGTAPTAEFLEVLNPNVLLLSPVVTDSKSPSCFTPGAGWTTVQANTDATSFPCAAVEMKVVSAGLYSATSLTATGHWVTGILPYASSPSTLPTASTTEIELTASAGQWPTSINTSNGTASNCATDLGIQYCLWIASGDFTPRISAITLSTGAVTTYNPGLPAGPDGADDHGAPSIGIDKNHYIHIVFGSHATALHYYKSTNPSNPSAFGALGSFCAGSTVESSTTFTQFFKSPVTNELYVTFHNLGSSAGDQYLCHYNTVTPAWESPSGLTAGQMTDFQNTANAYITAPQYDSSGTVWFSYLMSIAADCSNPQAACINDIYVVGWDGATSWKKFNGSAQTAPITRNNLSPVYHIGDGHLPCVNPLNGFAVDSNNVFFLPFKNCDASGFLQMYVAESSTGTFVGHQLTQNRVVYNAPNPLLIAVETQSPTIFSLGGCTYFTYPDIFRQTSGQAMLRSCNNFSTFSKMILTPRFNPNWTLFQDIGLQATQGKISFLFQRTNDPIIMFTYLNNDSANLGQILTVTWTPGGAGLRGNAKQRGSTVKR